MNSTETQSCFLCRQNKKLTYLEDSAFYAMLGWGPIVEGYSLIATKDHVPSMLDLSPTEAEHLHTFTQRVRRTIEPVYGPVIITEHGRVPACVRLDWDGREAHCFHAHRLVFPIQADLAGCLMTGDFRVTAYQDFVEARMFKWSTEYLYYERQDGTCLIAVAPWRVPRQFFRHKVAEHVGEPELVDWTVYPRIEFVDAARLRLLGASGESL